FAELDALYQMWNALHHLLNRPLLPYKLTLSQNNYDPITIVLLLFSLLFHYVVRQIALPFDPSRHILQDQRHNTVLNSLETLSRIVLSHSLYQSVPALEFLQSSLYTRLLRRVPPSLPEQRSLFWLLSLTMLSYL